MKTPDSSRYYAETEVSPIGRISVDTQHTMDSESLWRYVTTTKFSQEQKDLIHAAVFEGVPIEVHGIYVGHFLNVLLQFNYSVIAMAGRAPRRVKKFNTERPLVARIRNNVTNEEYLWVVVFPSPEYIAQITEVLHALAEVLTRSASFPSGADLPPVAVPIKSIHYPLCEEKIAEWSGLRSAASSLMELGDIAVIGHVEEVGVNLADHGYSLTHLVPIEQGYFGEFQLYVNEQIQRRIILLGVCHSFWGSAAGRICQCLAECGATDLVYIAKTGTFVGQRDVHSLVSPDTYYVLMQKETNASPGQWTWERFDVPSDFRSMLSSELRNIVTGAHLTVPTVMGETIEQSEQYRRLRPATIDNEIGYIARALAFHNRAVGHSMQTHFTCLHFVTDWLRTEPIGNRGRIFDLSDVDGERGAHVRERQNLAILTATKLLADFVATRRSEKVEGSISFRVSSELPTVSNWTGRSSESRALLEMLADERKGRVVVVSGGPGVGKSGLVSKCARDYLDGRKCSAYWISLDADAVTGRAPDFHEVADGLIYRLSSSTARVQTLKSGTYTDKISSIITLLAKHECLLVFDGVESLLEVGDSHLAGYFKSSCREYREFFRTLCNQVSSSPIVLTSRELLAELPPQLHRCFPLRGLRSDEGVDLLRKIGVGGSDQALDQIVERYHGNVKALELIVPLIRDDPGYAGSADVFLSERSWLLTGDLENLLADILSRLDQVERDCLSRIAVYDTARYPMLAPAILAQLPELPRYEARDIVVQALRRRNLLEPGRWDGSYDMHPLVREKALNDLKGTQRLSVAHLAASKYFGTLPVKSQADWQSIADITTRLECIRHASLGQDWKTAATLACDDQIRRALVRWGEHRQILQTYLPISTYIASVGAAQIGADFYAKAQNMLGIAYRNLGQPDVATGAFEAGLSSSENSSNAWRGILLGNLSLALIDQGRFEDGARRAEEALDLANSAGDHRGKAYALGNLGIAQFHLGRYSEARVCLLDDITSCGSDNLEGEAHAYGILGQVEHAVGNLQRAEECLLRSVFAFRKLGNYYREQEFLFRLAGLLRDQERISLAAICGRRCQTLARENGDQHLRNIEVFLKDTYTMLCGDEQREIDQLDDNQVGERLDRFLTGTSPSK